MPIKIVPIAPEHVEGFHAVLDVVARERRYLAMLEAPPIESVRAFVLNNIEMQNPQLVVLDDAAVVGWCDVLRKPRAVHRHCGTLGMGLLPTHRGRGLGLAILTRALAVCRTSGFTRVELTVNESNSRAIALYKKVGFQKEGLLRNDISIDGRYGNTVVMGIIDLDLDRDVSAGAS